MQCMWNWCLRYIQSTCATSGEGLYEGLDWLSSNIANKVSALTGLWFCFPPILNFSLLKKLTNARAMLWVFIFIYDLFSERSFAHQLIFQVHYDLIVLFIYFCTYQGWNLQGIGGAFSRTRGINAQWCLPFACITIMLLRSADIIDHLDLWLLWNIFFFFYVKKLTVCYLCRLPMFFFIYIYIFYSNFICYQLIVPSLLVF